MVIGRLAATALVAVALPLAGQAVPNRAAAYLFPTDGSDARALWVNPASTGTDRGASVFADVVVRDEDPGGAALAQVSAGFGSRGLSFGYQYDDLGPVRSHTYRVGVTGSSGPLAAGFAAAWYRGGANDWGYDVGLTYRARASVLVGVTVANIGQPVVRGVRQEFSAVPGLTLTPFGPSFELSALARFGGPEGYAFGARWHAPLRVALALLARVETDADLRGRGLAFGLALGARDQLGVTATTDADISRLEAVSAFGVASRRFR